MADRTLKNIEQKISEWEARHPKITLSEIKGEAQNLISSKANEIIRAQYQAAAGIIISQERAIEAGEQHFSRLIDELQNVSDNLESIENTLDWGFSEIVRCLNGQTNMLYSIRNAIESFHSNEAQEYRDWGEKDYRNGWFEEAIKHFLKSKEIYECDATVHHYLGKIYLYHVKDTDKAIDYFEKAYKYSKPYFKDFALNALLHKALTFYFIEDFKSAHETAQRALDLIPDSGTAHFDCSRYCALLGEKEKAIDHLRQAAKQDLHYCVKANYDPDFKNMRKELEIFFKEIGELWRSRAEQEISKVEEISKITEELGIKEDNLPYFDFLKEFESAKENLKRDKIIDNFEAAWSVRKAKRGIIEVAMSKFEKNLDAKIDIISELADKRSKEEEERIKEWEEKIKKIKKTHIESFWKGVALVTALFAICLVVIFFEQIKENYIMIIAFLSVGATLFYFLLPIFSPPLYLIGKIIEYLAKKMVFFEVGLSTLSDKIQFNIKTEYQKKELNKIKKDLEETKEKLEIIKKTSEELKKSYY